MRPTKTVEAPIPRSAQLALPRRVSVRAPLVLGVIAASAVGFLVDAAGIGRPDEPWFLLVVDSVASGEVLYRDTWFGTTPLSVYLAVPLVAAFGSQIAWIKLLVAVVFAVSVLLSVLLARRLRVEGGFPVVVMLAVVVFAAPGQYALYQPLATLFLAACFLATLAWHQAEGDAGLLLPLSIGVCAGLSFASKHTVGLLALAAALASFSLARTAAAERLRAGIAASASCLFVSFAILAPALVQAAGAFYEDAFAGKGAYLEHGAVSYGTGIREAASNIAEASFHVSQRFLAVYWVALFVVAVFAVVATGWFAYRGRHSTREGTVVFLFTGAAFASAYPRFDYPHFVFAAPVLVVGAAYALAQIGRSLSRLPVGIARVAVGIALAVAVSVLVARPAARLTAGGERLSDLPHFRAALVEPRHEDRDRRIARLLAREAGARPMFLFMADAAFYYLLSGVENPTKFDFPTVTALGRSGQGSVTRGLERGRITQVCVDERSRLVRDATQLYAFIEKRMVPVADLGPCRLYRGLRSARI
jgi:4-amino-4-deoxy-L-arabinose transferase-like glycosyltransferase